MRRLLSGTVAVVATLACTTNDPTRSSVIYKLVCVAPPMTDPGEGASPTQRLTSPLPDAGAAKTRPGAVAIAHAAKGRA